MGLCTTTLALGAAFVLAKIIPVSNLLSNVVTMVGLAIGIDYSLLMVTHYRENQPNESVAERVADTVARAGQTITWSGVTVMIGFLGLLFSPILETRCAGIGGALVVCVSVMAALTLLPAALVLVGPYLERWSVIPARLRLGNTTAMWLRLGRWIVKHPIKMLVISGACVVLLGLPLTKATTGVSNERWFLPPGRRVTRRRRHSCENSRRQFLLDLLRHRARDGRSAGARRRAHQAPGRVCGALEPRPAHRLRRLALHAAKGPRRE